jgi:hypothetical protein
MLCLEPWPGLHLWPDTYLITEWEAGSRHGTLNNGYCTHCQTTPYSNYWIHCQTLNSRLHSGYCEQFQTLNTIVAHLQTLNIIQWFLCTVPDTWWQHSSHKIICGNSWISFIKTCFTNINLIIGVFQIQLDLVVCSLSSIEFWRRSKWHATTACTGCLKTQLQCHTKSGMT